MIAYKLNKEDFDYDQDRFVTSGCGCCSKDLMAEDDRAEILKHTSGNIRVAMEVCEHYGLNFEEFCNNVRKLK